MNTIYLAGKMTGLTRAQMSWWREYAVDLLMGHFRIHDPASTKLSESLTNREIVDSNKFQIMHSNIVLVELDHEDVSIGALGEIVFARENGKPVIAWGKARRVIEHPWVQEHITIHFPRLESAVAYVIQNYA